MSEHVKTLRDWWEKCYHMFTREKTLSLVFHQRDWHMTTAFLMGLFGAISLCQQCCEDLSRRSDWGEGGEGLFFSETR